MTIRIGSVAWAIVLSGLVTAEVSAGSPAAADQDDARAEIEGAVEALRAAASGNVRIERSRSGLVRFLAVSGGLPVSGPTAKAGQAPSPASKATAFLQAHGEAFGLGAAPQVQVRRSPARDRLGMEHVRFQQTSHGLPVAGAELVVHLRGDSVAAVNGHSLDEAELSAVPSQPKVTADQALAVARAVMARPRPTFSSPRLEIFNRGLLEGRTSPSRLAWFVTARAERVQELIWIDAETGVVLLHFNQQPDARQREVYGLSGGEDLWSPPNPELLVRGEGQPASGDAEADSAYVFAGNWYDYFQSHFGRDSIDDAGQPLILNVHYGGGLPNAFWDANAEQMAFSDGAALADDVVAHEITHGLTQHTASLFYYMQSGALNEAMSDVFGETLDLANGTGTDTPAVRWLFGEDWAGRGAIRDMMNPTTFGDPGKVSDPEVRCLGPDAGGVHSNSGLMNHAFALAVDGGTYNGRTVTGIGLDKAAAVVYRALAVYFTSATTFADADTLLRQSCQDLAGTVGITAEDCANFGLALDAVEMGETWACDRGGRISGTVTGPGGAPLAGIWIDVYDANHSRVDWTTSDASGAYATNGGLATGTYYVGTQNWGGYVNQIWNGLPCPSDCSRTAGTPIALTAGSTTPGIDFSLAVGGRISGRVTDSSGAPLEGIQLSVMDTSGSSIAVAFTDAAGDYVIPNGLPTGSYYLRTYNSLGRIDELWSGLPCLAGCDETSGAPIMVFAGSTTRGIDFVLDQGARVSGVVTGDGGDPLRSVFVEIYDSAGALVSFGLTNAAGVYTTGGVPSGTYFVRTRNFVGYLDEVWNDMSCWRSCAVTSGTPLTVFAGSTTSGIDFVLAPASTLGGRISGTVTAASGEPLSGVSVFVYDGVGRHISSATTDASGAYLTQPALPAGSYFVATFDPTGHLNEVWNDVPCLGSCVPTSGAPIAVAAESMTSGIDFVLAPGGRIAGRVTNTESEDPIPGATVEFFDAAGQQLSSATTNESGDYVSSAGLPTGTYFARARSNDVWQDALFDGRPCASCDVTAGTSIPVAAGTTTSRVDFSLPRGGRITGRVTDLIGTPLSGYAVAVEALDGGPVRRLSTDADGDYVASGLPPGEYRLYTSGWIGYVDEVYDDIPFASLNWGGGGTPVTVAAGADTTGIDFVLGRGGTVTGRVTDEATGLGIPNVAVGIWDAGMTWISASTDADGIYSLARVPGGTYDLRAAGAGGYLGEHFQEAASEVEATPLPVPDGITMSGIDFVLAAGGRVSGTVKDAETGLPLANILVTLFDGNGQSVSQAMTDGVGSYTTGAGVATGRYYARATSLSYNYAVNAGYLSQCHGGEACPWLTRNQFLTTRGTPIDVVAGSTTMGIDFALHRGGRIAGRVVRAGTTVGLPGASVSVFDGGNHLVSTAIGRSDGSYVTTEGLPAGTYFVVGRATKYAASLYDTGSDAACSLDPYEALWSCDAASGTPVEVALGATTPGVEIALERGGTITGTVRDAATGRRIRSSVEIFDAGGRLVGKTATGFTGSYRSDSLPSGTYSVRSHNVAGYVDVTYGTNEPCGRDCIPLAATPVTVSAGQATLGVDFDLHKGARISGRVVELATGRGYSGMEMLAYDAGGVRVSEGTTDRDGRYWTASTLPDGTYYVKANSRSSHPSLLYGGAVCVGECDPRNGTPVVIAGGADASDIDFALGARLAVGDATVAEGGSAVFTVTLSQPVGEPVSVDYETVAGTASAGSDFTPLSGTLTFPANVTMQTLAVPTLQDVRDEADLESFTLLLTSPTGVVIADGEGVGTIEDDDAPPSVSIGNASMMEGNSGTRYATFGVTLSAPSERSVAVSYASADGTATAGIDYGEVSGGLVFAPNTTSLTVSAPVYGDPTAEADETFAVKLAEPRNAVLGDDVGVGTILNDDFAGALEVADANVVEAGGAASVVVTLSAPSVLPVTVGYATADVTAMAGADYVANTGALTFAPGVVSQAIQVTILPDAVEEDAETFLVVLSSPTNATIGDGEAAVTILDDDGAPVRWTRRVGVTASGGTLTRPAGSGWNAGAVSRQVVVSGDGYAEYTVTEAAKDVVFGLSHADASQGSDDVDFAIETEGASGRLHVLENGVDRGELGAFAAGDRLRVGVEGGVVQYRRNGVLLGTSGALPVYPLLVDTSLSAAGATVQDARMGGNLGESVRWTQNLDVREDDFDLTRSSGSGWTAGAASTRAIVSGDGRAEYTVTSDTTDVAFGLSHGNAAADLADIDFALATDASTGLLVAYQNGVCQGSLGGYGVGDRLGVAVSDGAVEYLRNGEVLSTSALAPAYPLLVDASLGTAGAAVVDAVLVGEAIAENVVWLNPVNATVEGATLRRAAGTGWTAGAVSVQAIASGDGWAEFTVADTTTNLMFGLSHGDDGQSYADVDFAIYTYPATGRVMVYEGGISRGSFGGYGAGDRLRVSVEDGVVKYSRNGAVFYTSRVAPVYPLLVDTSMYKTGAAILDARIDGELVDNALWVREVGATSAGVALSRLAGTGWAAGAVSRQGIVFGDGAAEYTVSSLSDYVMFGLSHGDTNQAYADIDFALYTYAARGQLRIYEGGTSRGLFGSYAVGDRLRVAAEGGVVKYYRNGTLLYTSAAAPAYPLTIDTSLYSSGAQVKEAILSGNLGEVFPPDPDMESLMRPVTWTGLVDVTAAGSTLTRPSGRGWNAGAVSSLSSVSGDVCVDYTVTSASDYVMFGLSHGDSDQGYADLDFALYTYAPTAQLWIYEGGTSRGHFASYAPGDQLQVCAKGGAVGYYRNGAQLYTSKLAPVYPLLLDTSFYSPGATVSGARIGGVNLQ